MAQGGVDTDGPRPPATTTKGGGGGGAGKRASEAAALYSILYAAVFSCTLAVHSALGRPFRHASGPRSLGFYGGGGGGKGGGATRRGRRRRHHEHHGHDVVHEVAVEERILAVPSSNGNRDDSTAFDGGITDGGTIASILTGKAMFPTEGKDLSRRLRFEPGTISNLTQAETLRRCYADPSVYSLHYPMSDRQVTSVSHPYRLVLLLVPKSGSSTGRWVMERVLDGETAGIDPAGGDLDSTYGEYTVMAFVRDPLSRFYSQYDEAFLRYGPWMRSWEGKAWQGMKTFEHPFPYLYENMTDWGDYQDAFCPPGTVPESVRHRKHWCSAQETRENGTLASRFERFVREYDGLSPWDMVSYRGLGK